MKRLLTLLLSVAMFLAATVPMTVQAASRPTADELDVLDVYGYCNYQEAFKCLDYINQYRADYGRQPLVMDKTLMEIAMCRAAECAVYWGHGRPNKMPSEPYLSCPTVVYDGVEYDYDFFVRYDGHGNCDSVGGENLTSNCYNGETAALSWYNSEGHRKNFLQTAKSTGVGCFKYAYFTIFIQIFATISPEEAKPSEYPEGDILRTFKVEATNGRGSYEQDYQLSTSVMDIEYDNEQISGQSAYVGEEQDKLVLRITDGRMGYQTAIIDPSKVTYSSDNPEKVSVDENGIFTVLVNEDTKATLYTEYQGNKYPVTITIKKSGTEKPIQKEDETPPTEQPSDTEQNDVPVLNGWQKINNKWYLYDYGRALTGWQKVNGKWYLLSYTDSHMLTGWVKAGNKWYYLDSSGAMQTGWKKIGGKWYYLNRSGAMQTGWQKVGSKWYYLNSSGTMQTGWKKLSNKWYYMNRSGVMQTGWLRVNGKWYYFNSNGKMLTGTQRINGKRYYFYSSGVLR